jgi:hypothetical protein
MLDSDPYSGSETLLSGSGYRTFSQDRFCFWIKEIALGGLNQNLPAKTALYISALVRDFLIIFILLFSLVFYYHFILRKPFNVLSEARIFERGIQAKYHHIKIKGSIERRTMLYI